MALTLTIHQASAVTNLEGVGRIGRGGGATTEAGGANGFMTREVIRPRLDGGQVKSLSKKIATGHGPFGQGDDEALGAVDVHRRVVKAQRG